MTKTKLKMKPFIDADEPIMFPVMPRHVRAAQPADPDHCIIALAAKSVRGIHKARIGAAFAYIIFDDDRTQPIRYQVSYRSLGVTRLFDTAPDEFKRAPQLITRQEIILNPPAPSMRKGYKAGKPGKPRTADETVARRKKKPNPEATRHMTFWSDWK